MGMPKRYSSKKLISILQADGWTEVGAVGSHRHFKHPTKPGKVTVAHPKRDVPAKAAN